MSVRLLTSTLILILLCACKAAPLKRLNTRYLAAQTYSRATQKALSESYAGDFLLPIVSDPSIREEIHEVIPLIDEALREEPDSLLSLRRIELIYLSGEAREALGRAQESSSEQPYAIASAIRIGAVGEASRRMKQWEQALRQQRGTAPVLRTMLYAELLNARGATEEATDTLHTLLADKTISPSERLMIYRWIVARADLTAPNSTLVQLLDYLVAHEKSDIARLRAEALRAYLTGDRVRLESWGEGESGYGYARYLLFRSEPTAEALPHAIRGAREIVWSPQERAEALRQMRDFALEELLWEHLLPLHEELLKCRPLPLDEQERQDYERYAALATYRSDIDQIRLRDAIVHRRTLPKKSTEAPRRPSATATSFEALWGHVPNTDFWALRGRTSDDLSGGTSEVERLLGSPEYMATATINEPLYERSVRTLAKALSEVMKRPDLAERLTERLRKK